MDSKVEVGKVERAIRYTLRGWRGLRSKYKLKKELYRPSAATDDGTAAPKESAKRWGGLAGGFIARGQLKLAMQLRRRAVELAPGNVQLRTQLVRELLLAGRSEEANSVDGGLAPLWRQLAGELVAQGRLELGLHGRRRAVELAPDDPQLRMELVRELLLAGRSEEAKSADGHSSQVWRALGGELAALGYRELGLYCRHMAVERDPSNSQVRVELIRDLLDTDPGNLTALTTVKDAVALSAIAGEFLANNETDSAIKLLERVVKINGANDRARNKLIGLLLANGLVGDAIEVAKDLDATKIPQPYHRRPYKDFTPTEKCTAVEASAIALASLEAVVELARAVEYILQNNIAGAFVECGVFKGGNAAVMIRTLLHAKNTDREIYLYDTFEGFPKPEAIDYEYFGGAAIETWNEFKNDGDRSEDGSDWLRDPIERVRVRVLSLGYPAARIKFVKGLVEDTLPREAPEKIALLRLDTDFYRSTKHELVHLFPRLQRGGILIIGGYGAMHGARTAVDEYLAENKVAFFTARVDEYVCIGVKL
jgi:O-methyltransferase